MYTSRKRRRRRVVTYQYVMHALKFYEVMRVNAISMQESASLFNFFDFDNSDNRGKDIAGTIDLDNGVAFPHLS